MTRAHSVNTFDAILASAQLLMTEAGYENTSISMICRHAGGPNGSIYHYFANKAALLAEVVERAGGGFWQDITDNLMLQPEEECVDDRLRLLLDVVADAVSRNAPFLRLQAELTRIHTEHEELVEPIRARKAYSHGRLTTLLEESLGSPEAPFPREAAQSLAKVIMSFTLATVLETRGDPQRTKAAFHDLYFALRHTLA